MQPWQVSLGLSVATVIPAAYLLYRLVGYLDGFWGVVWEYYAFHMVVVPSAAVLVMVFGYYHLARVFFLGDVGSRIQVMDRSIRAGQSGDPELAEALRREEQGDYQS